MNFPVDFQRLLPIFAVIAVAIAAVALVVRGLGGGGGGAAGGASQQALEQALGGGGGAGSGKFNATLAVSLQGVPPQVARPVTAKFSGAFERPKGGKPRFDLEGTLDAAGQNLSFGVISTGDKAFVKVRGKTYLLPAGQLQQAGTPNASSLTSLGVDPKSWFTNVRDAGTATVAGVAVQHLTADFDAARAVADLRNLAAKSGQGQQVPQSAQTTIADAVKQAKVDLYSGKSDHVLRKLTVVGQLAGSAPSGGPALHGTVNFDLEVTDVNHPQQITTPRNATPIGAAPSRPQGANHRTHRTRGTAGARSQSSSQAYVSCVQAAPDIQALNKCQALLP